MRAGEVLTRQRICFVATNRKRDRFRGDPSFIYRCENIGLFLERLGHDVRFVHLAHAPTPASVDLVVFHRPRASWRLRWVLSRLRRAGVVAIADVDDLVFDEAYAQYSPGVVNGINSLFFTRRIFRAHRLALSWFSHLSTSTEALVERLRSQYPLAKVALLTNSVHMNWLSLPREAEAPQDGARVLTYLPGTRSHDQDFALMAEPLARFLMDRPEVSLHITGPLGFHLPARAGQVVHRPKVPFDQYAERLRGAWANLAPLEATPFNRSKSALKVLEAGFWGIPTLCSPNLDMARFLGAGAVVVEDHDWYASLTRLRDDAVYSGLTADLSAKVLARANGADQADQLLELAALARRSMSGR